MFVSTNYSRQQIMLASIKCSHRQNGGVYKVFASTKCWRQQNIRVYKMLAHVRKRLLTVSARQSPQQLLSPRPRWCSPTSPRRCWSLHMQSPSVLLPLAALLLWADSLPHCTGLFYRPPKCRKHHKYRRWQNIGARQDFTAFHQTIAVYTFAHRHPIKDWWK